MISFSIIVYVVLNFFFSYFLGCNSRICDSQGLPCHSEKCNASMLCSHGKNHCFSLWENSTEGTVVLKKGCWHTNPEECINGRSCFGTPRQRGQTTVFFCCCYGDNCNRNFSLAPVSQWRLRTRRPSGNGKIVSVQLDYINSVMAPKQ